jgi:hypothetical protein
MVTRTKIEEGDGDRRHGSPNGYANLHCRCVACRAAWTQANVSARQRRYQRTAAKDPAVPHGEPHTYLNWGCRCALCLAAYKETRLGRLP